MGRYGLRDDDKVGQAPSILSGSAIVYRKRLTPKPVCATGFAAPKLLSFPEPSAQVAFKLLAELATQQQ